MPHLVHCLRVCKEGSGKRGEDRRSVLALELFFVSRRFGSTPACLRGCFRPFGLFLTKAHSRDARLGPRKSLKAPTLEVKAASG